MNQNVRINVHLRGEIARMFWQIKNHMGLQNDTEVLRSIIKWYHRQNREELPSPFIHLNTYEDTVLIRDKMIGSLVTLHVKPAGERGFRFYCEHCEATNCIHVLFATTVPGVLGQLEEQGYIYRGELKEE